MAPKLGTMSELAGHLSLCKARARDQRGVLWQKIAKVGGLSKAGNDHNSICDVRLASPHQPQKVRVSK